MEIRKLGYLPDPPDKRDLNLRSLQLPQQLPSNFSLRQHVREVLDQGATSSCVANAFAQAIATAEERLGITIELPSRLYIYYNSRRQHDHQEVTDSGTYLRTAAAGLQKLGAPPEREWPFKQDDAHVNLRPPFESYMRAHGRRGGGYWRIAEGGADRVQAVKSALYAGMPVAFGTNVSESFLDEGGPEVISTPGSGERIAGGHAMAIVGYETTQKGTLFEVVNSWGRVWRDEGFFKMTEAYLCWLATSDLWCVRGWEVTRQPNV